MTVSMRAAKRRLRKEGGYACPVCYHYQYAVPCGGYCCANTGSASHGVGSLGPSFAELTDEQRKIYEASLVFDPPEGGIDFSVEFGRRASPTPPKPVQQSEKHRHFELEGFFQNPDDMDDIARAAKQLVINELTGGDRPEWRSRDILRALLQLVQQHWPDESLTVQKAMAADMHWAALQKGNAP